MTPALEAYESAPSEESIRAPRVPAFSSPRPSDAELATRRLGFEANRMGACVFMVVEGIFFGSLFALYSTLRSSEPEVFLYGRYFLDAKVGAMQNCILLASALTAALAVRAAKHRQGRNVTALAAATLVLGGLFLSAQGSEFAGLSERGLLPGRQFAPSESVWETAAFKREHPNAARYAAAFQAVSRVTTVAPLAREVSPLQRVGALGPRAVYASVPSEPRNAHVFFGLYFLFTGLVGIHVFAGSVGWGWLLLRARAPVFRRHDFVHLDSLALSWHLIALVRVLMFPILYLVH